jgi:hypothetical protein
MTNHDPRMNRISSIVLVELPPNTASIRHPLVFKVHVFLNCLQVALRIPLVCIVTLCLCLFWPLILKNPLVCKTQLGNRTKMCFPSHLFMSARVAYVRY